MEVLVVTWVQRLKVWLFGESVEYAAFTTADEIRPFFAQIARHLAAGVITNDAYEYGALHADLECTRLGV